MEAARLLLRYSSVADISTCLGSEKAKSSLTAVISEVDSVLRAIA